MDNLYAFLLDRYQETDARLRKAKVTEPEHDSDASWALTVEMWDHVACMRTIVNAAVKADPTHPLAQVMRRMSLVLVQPFEQHTDFDPAWLTELAGYLTPTTTEEG